MNIIRKILPVLLVVILAISGCVTSGGNVSINDDSIIANHVSMYAASTNSQNDDIAAILREFSSYTVVTKFSSWDDLMKKENAFMLNLTNGISYYYPVVPSDEEIKISDSFLDTIIIYDSYYNVEWISSVNQRIPSVSTRFITRMNDYEYNTRTNK